MFRSFVISIAVCLFAAPLWGQGPPLKWGGDKAGGAPFIFEQPGIGDTGFEVDLANLLAKKLGRTAQFVQGEWDSIPDTVLRGNIDIALNGYEFLSKREKELPSTVPYFVYSLRLIVRKDDTQVTTWEDLKKTKTKYRVAVLGGSFAETYLRDNFGDFVELIPSKDVSEVFQLLQEGERLDATVQDSPAAIHYIEGGVWPALKVVGKPAGAGYYVILTRPQDRELRDALSKAIKETTASGELEAIYRKYNLWTDEQKLLKELHEKPWPPPDDGRKSINLWDIRGRILKAAGMTIALACLSMPIAILLGVLVAVGRVYGPGWLKIPLAAYVEVLRGTPLILQMFVWFFLLPSLARSIGWQPLIYIASMEPFFVGVLALAINYSAWEAENYRAGLQAIPKGQMEAALALGMTPPTAIRKIILPQAFRIVIPPVTNDFIALFKDTSICSMILITELTGLYYQLKSDPNIALELALVVGGLYLLISFPASLLARRYENKLKRGSTII